MSRCPRLSHWGTVDGCRRAYRQRLACPGALRGRRSAGNGQLTTDDGPNCKLPKSRTCRLHDKRRSLICQHDFVNKCSLQKCHGRGVGGCAIGGLPLLAFRLVAAPGRPRSSHRAAKSSSPAIPSAPPFGAGPRARATGKGGEYGTVLRGMRRRRIGSSIVGLSSKERRSHESAIRRLD
jgi:hypothetical protein